MVNSFHKRGRTHCGQMAALFLRALRPALLLGPSRRAAATKATGVAAHAGAAGAAPAAAPATGTAAAAPAAAAAATPRAVLSLFAKAAVLYTVADAATITAWTQLSSEENVSCKFTARTLLLLTIRCLGAPSREHLARTLCLPQSCNATARSSYGWQSLSTSAPLLCLQWLLPAGMALALARWRLTKAPQLVSWLRSALRLGLARPQLPARVALAAHLAAYASSAYLTNQVLGLSTVAADAGYERAVAGFDTEEVPLTGRQRIAMPQLAWVEEKQRAKGD